MAREVDGASPGASRDTQEDTPPAAGATLGRIFAGGVLAALVAAPQAEAQVRSEPQQPTPAQKEAGGARLLEQARYWSNQGRDDLALQSLERLLQVEPNNPSALYELARIHLKAGDLQKAQTAAARLRRLVGEGGLYAQLRREMNLASLDNGALRQARQAAANGDYAVALQIYNNALRGQTLTGDLAIEYYETMAGIEGRAMEAREALAKLAAGSPNDANLKLAVARVSSYIEETRRDAIRTLLQIAESAPYKERALDSARDALLWLAAKTEDKPLFDAYLAVRPDDGDVKGAWASALRPSNVDQAAIARAHAYSLLEENDAAAAEQEFRALLLENPKDGEATAGLGIALGRLENFAEAEDLLRRAIRLDPNKREEYQRALDAVAFSSDLREVRRLAELGEPEAAEIAIARLKPPSALDKAQIALVRAEIAAKVRDWREAQIRYSEALDLAPKLDAAFVGLVGAAIEAGDAQQVERVLLRPIIASQNPEVRAAVGKARGWNAIRRGDVNAAAQWYSEALEATPRDAWLRLAAARAMLAGGAEREADSLFAGAEASRNPDMVHAAALFAFDRKNWSKAEALLAMLPEDRRTPDMQRLLAHARVELGVRRSMLTAASDTGEARRALLALYSPGVSSPDEVMLIASGLLETGDKRLAVMLIRQALQSNASATPEDVAGAARMLIAGGDHDGAQMILETVDPNAMNLRQADRTSLSNVYDDLLIARSREAMQRNDLIEALDLVGPVYEQNPVHPGALRTLAEINVRAGRREEGLSFYVAALDVNAQDRDALRGAVGTATGMRRYRDAQEFVDSALTRTPNDPELYLLRADIAKARGDLKSALADLEMARRVDMGGRAMSPMGGAQIGMRSGNPFRDAMRAQAASPMRTPGLLAPTLFDAPEPTPRRSTQWIPPALSPPAWNMPALAAPASYAPPAYWPPTPAWVGKNVSERVRYDRGGSAAAAPAVARAEPLVLQNVEPVAYFTPAVATSEPAPLLTEIRYPSVQLIVDQPEQAPAQSYATPQYNAPQYGPLNSDLSAPYRPWREPQPFTNVRSTDNGGVRDRLAALGNPGSSMPTRTDFGAPPAERARTREFYDWKIADLRNQDSSSISETLGFRWRNGEEGLSQLTEFSTPMEMTLTPGGGELYVRAEPVFLTAGNLSSDPLSLRRFGAIGTLDPTVGPGSVFPRTAPDVSDAAGIGLGIGYRLKHFTLSLGTTPIGFEATSILGAAEFKWGTTKGLSIEASLAREPIKDSVLSYAGAIDPVTGKKFGGAVATRGKFGVSKAWGKLGIYGVGTFGTVTADEAASNTSVQLDGGAFVKFIDDEKKTLSSGFSLTYLGYKESQRNFTLGQAGYFSPQAFVSATIPLSYEWRDGPFEIRTSGALGVQYFSEESSSYYPGRSDLVGQALFQIPNYSVLAPSIVVETQYPDMSRTTLAARGGFDLTYKLTPTLHLTGGVSLDRAADWTEATGMIGLRYWLGGEN